MDSKAMGNDLCVGWPRAEIAVMGASGAVGSVHRRHLARFEGKELAEERARLEVEYAEQHCSARVAAAWGFVDDLIEPADTRSVLGAALRALAAEREHCPRAATSPAPVKGDRPPCCSQARTCW